MIPSKLLVFGSVVFSTFCAATPVGAEEEHLGLVALNPRSAECKAVRKHHYRVGNKNGDAYDTAVDEERARFEMDDAYLAEYYSKPPNYNLPAQNEHHCRIEGHLVDPPAPTYQMAQITIRQCANWCICTLGSAYCKSFGYTQTSGNLGTCSAYDVQARYLQYAKGGGGIFYARHCFVRRPPIQPHPPPMTTKPYGSSPTKRAKREDVLGDLVAHALEGL